MSNKTGMDVEGLRTILAEEILNLRQGKTTPAKINAITNAAGKIFASVKLEMEYAKVLGKTPEIGFIKLNKEPVKAIKEK